MHPCRYLKEAMRTVQSAPQFDEIMKTFLDWRLRYDDAVSSGREQLRMEAMPV
jgi:hypothetical protein